MRNIIGGLLILVVTGVFSFIQADLLFEDNFDNNDNWVVAIGQPTGTVSGGKYTIQSNASSITLLKHSSTFSSFTYTVKMKIESANTQGCGVLFCMQDNYASYMFCVMANKQYYFGRWEVVGTQVSFKTLVADWNSFLTDSDNIIQISKSGSDINLFVNGVYLTKVSDNTVGDGAIGLAVGSGEKASFDYACVTDDVKEGQANTWFSDDFEDSDLDGWRLLKGNGTVKAESGVLKIAPVDSTVMLYTNGAYKDMPCTTVVEYKDGNKALLYGILFLDIKPSQTINSYYFFINGNRSYIVFSNSQSGTLKAHSDITGVKDTLIVTKNYEFIVNGTMLDDSTFSQGLDFNAAGVYVDPGLSIEFDDFSVGENTGTPIVHKPIKSPVAAVKPSYILGGSGIIYDTRGRKVATFNNGYRDKLKDLSAGPYYIVIPNGGKNHIIRRAVINSQ